MKIPEVGVWYYKLNNTDELKYSIRSAVNNLGLKKIILVGDKPRWFKETENSIYVKSAPRRNPSYTLAYVPWQHMETFVNSGVYKGEFLLFNDDFYVLKPLKTWVDYYRDPLDYDVKCGSRNRIYHRRELRALQTLGKPLNSNHYNLHMPMRMNTEDLRKAVQFWNSSLNKDFEFRTTYGNMFPRPEEAHRDVKYDNDGTFLSGGDKLWYEETVANLFPNKVFCEK